MRLVKILNILMVIILTVGCRTIEVSPQQEDYLSKSEITFSDIQTVSRSLIESLILDDILNSSNDEKPFIVIKNINNSALPHIKTTFLSQDVRLSLLLSNKAVTTPDLSIEKGKKMNLDQFNYILSGEVSKEVLPVKDGTVDVYYIKYQLKDIKSKKIVWKKRENFTR